MGLTMSKEQLNSEYKMYENIEEYIEMDDGKRGHHKKIHPDLSEVMGKMYERKLIYDNIKSYMDKGEKSERAEERLQAMLDANSAYFINMPDENKEKCQKLFNSGTEYLGKSVDWQNYRMLFTDLQGKNFDKLFGSILFQVQERRAQVGRVKDAVDAIHKKSTGFTGHQTFAGVIQEYRAYDKKVKDLEEQKLSKVKEREKEDKAIQKMFDDAEKKYGKTIDSDKTIIKDNQSRQEQLRKRVKTYNEAVAKVETTYTNSVQAIETGLKTELENDKKELENLKTVKKELKEKGSQTEAEWYTWGENYNNPDLKRYVGAMKNRYIIGEIKSGLSDLKENPEFKLSECIYGKEDSKIREKYPILDWIKQYMEFKKDSEELKARQVKEAEEAERKAEEIENNVVENENVEEIENDVVENENSEKKEFKLVEGETTYDELITSMDDELENMDDIYWEEIGINEKKLPEDILKISKNFEQIADNLYEEAGKKNKEIAEKEKAITEKENEVSTKMEEAKGLRDRLKEQHLYDNFNPQSPKNKIGKDGMFDKFKGDYSTFPEQVEGVLKIYDDEIKTKEANVAKLEPLYNADIEKAEQARKAYDDKKGTHKAEIINIDKKIEEIEILQRHGAKLGGYSQVKPLVDEFTNACKDTFSIKPNQEYKEKEMVDSIKQQAAEWLKIEGLHTGNHKNSIEYDRMITAFKMVAEYPTNVAYADKFKGKELPISFDETLAFMKEQAENYKKAKDEQWRPFPSRMRNHRNTMAKFMIGFAERSMKGIAAQKELVELDYYIQTRGKSQGLDKDELIKDVMEAAGLKLPEREKTSTDKNMTTQKETTETQKETKETQKEAKEIKEPELEDDGGMSMR